MMWDHAHPWKLQNINGMFLGDFPDPSSPGPFSEAQNTFLLGGIIFLLAGAFDNENANLIKIIKKVKKTNCDEGISISPCPSIDQKDGATRITHQEFKQALNVAITRGQALHKLNILNNLCNKTQE